MVDPLEDDGVPYARSRAAASGAPNAFDLNNFTEEAFEGVMQRQAIRDILSFYIVPVDHDDPTFNELISFLPSFEFDDFVGHFIVKNRDGSPMDSARPFLLYNIHFNDSYIQHNAYLSMIMDYMRLPFSLDPADYDFRDEYAVKPIHKMLEFLATGNRIDYTSEDTPFPNELALLASNDESFPRFPDANFEDEGFPYSQFISKLINFLTDLRNAKAVIRYYTKMAVHIDEFISGEEPEGLGNPREIGDAKGIRTPACLRDNNLGFEIKRNWVNYNALKKGMLIPGVDGATGQRVFSEKHTAVLLGDNVDIEDQDALNHYLGEELNRKKNPALMLGEILDDAMKCFSCALHQDPPSDQDIFSLNFFDTESYYFDDIEFPGYWREFYNLVCVPLLPSEKEFCPAFAVSPQQLRTFSRADRDEVMRQREVYMKIRVLEAFREMLRCLPEIQRQLILSTMLWSSLVSRCRPGLNEIIHGDTGSFSSIPVTEIAGFFTSNAFRVVAVLRKLSDVIDSFNASIIPPIQIPQVEEMSLGAPPTEEAQIPSFDIEGPNQVNKEEEEEDDENDTSRDALADHHVFTNSEPLDFYWPLSCTKSFCTIVDWPAIAQYGVFNFYKFLCDSIGTRINYMLIYPYMTFPQDYGVPSRVLGIQENPEGDPVLKAFIIISTNDFLLAPGNFGCHGLHKIRHLFVDGLLPATTVSRACIGPDGEIVIDPRTNQPVMEEVEEPNFFEFPIRFTPFNRQEYEIFFEDLQDPSSFRGGKFNYAQVPMLKNPLDAIRTSQSARRNTYLMFRRSKRCFANLIALMKKDERDGDAFENPIHPDDQGIIELMSEQLAIESGEFDSDDDDKVMDDAIYEQNDEIRMLYDNLTKNENSIPLCSGDEMPGFEEEEGPQAEHEEKPAREGE